VNTLVEQGFLITCGSKSSAGHDALLANGGVGRNGSELFANNAISHVIPPCEMAEKVRS